MTRYHATSAGNVPFTAEEESARDAEESANQAAIVTKANKAIGDKSYKALIRRRAAQLPTLEAMKLLKTIGE